MESGWERAKSAGGKKSKSFPRVVSLLRWTREFVIPSFAPFLSHSLSLAVRFSATWLAPPQDNRVAIENNIKKEKRKKRGGERRKNTKTKIGNGVRRRMRKREKERDGNKTTYKSEMQIQESRNFCRPDQALGDSNVCMVKSSTL